MSVQSAAPAPQPAPKTRIEIESKIELLFNQDPKTFATELSAWLVENDVKTIQLMSFFNDPKDKKETYDSKQFLPALFEAISKSPCVTAIRLPFNRIDSNNIKELAAKFPECPSLVTLDLAGNELGAQGVIDLATRIFPKLPNLQQLDLSFTKCDENGAKALAYKFLLIPKLTTLNLIGNRIGTEGAKAIATYINYCPGLTDLDLSSTELGDEGAYEFAVALSKNPPPSLRSLSLNTIGITEAGADALATFLNDCPNLKELDLSHNHVDDTQANHLLETLANQLDSLNLEDNPEISPEVYRAVTNAFKAKQDPNQPQAAAEVEKSRDLERKNQP